MAGVMSMFNSALSFGVDLQKVHEGVCNGTTYIGEAVNSKIGERRSFKTAQGTSEVIELGPIGNSANIIKVRCCRTGTDFIMKRLEIVNTASKTISGNPGLVSVEAMQALALRAELIPTLPPNPNLVQCFSSQADNAGLTPAKVLLLELCGESLAETLTQKGGSMKPDEILHVLRDVADGLFCLHSLEKGPVVHGSLQPEHILRDTKTGTWKLGSYGAAHTSMEDDPEDAASDIWQLGLLLLTLLFGATAFPKQSLITEMTPSAVHNALLASVTIGRPCNNVEGRILLLATWLLAADPAKRPTAEQVVIAAGTLGELPAPQLALAFPTAVHKDFRALCMALVRRTIFVAINNIEGSDLRILINKYGEKALRNPGSLPNSVKQGALSTDQTNYIRVIQSFLPADQDKKKLSPQAMKLQDDLARTAVAMQFESEPMKTQEPVDMLDFSSETCGPPSQNSVEPPEVQEPSLVDISSVDSSPCSAQADLLGSMESLPSTPGPALSVQVGTQDAFSLQSAAPQQPKTLNLDALYNMPAGQAASEAIDGGLSNPFDMPQQLTPHSVNGFGGYAAPLQPSHAPIIGMTQIKPPKKEEPKDPFAGLAGF